MQPTISRLLASRAATLRYFGVSLLMASNAAAENFEFAKSVRSATWSLVLILYLNTRRRRSHYEQSVESAVTSSVYKILKICQHQEVILALENRIYLNPLAKVKYTLRTTHYRSIQQILKVIENQWPEGRLWRQGKNRWRLMVLGSTVQCSLSYSVRLERATLKSYSC